MPPAAKNLTPKKTKSEGSVRATLLSQTSIKIDVAKCLYAIAAIIVASNPNDVIAALETLF